MVPQDISEMVAMDSQSWIDTYVSPQNRGIEQPGSESLYDGVITEVAMIRSGGRSSVNDEAGS